MLEATPASLLRVVLATKTDGSRAVLTAAAVRCPYLCCAAQTARCMPCPPGHGTAAVYTSCCRVHWECRGPPVYGVLAIVGSLSPHHPVKPAGCGCTGCRHRNCAANEFKP